MKEVIERCNWLVNKCEDKALTPDVKDDVRYLLEEIERLNNIINEFNNAYSKVITKCNQMINSRYYMNEIAIEKYAAEIKDICYFYVEEAKELKGVDKSNV